MKALPRREFLKYSSSALFATSLFWTPFSKSIAISIEKGETMKVKDDAILLAAPNSSDSYYDTMLDELIKFYRALFKNAHKDDFFLIVADGPIREELIKSKIGEQHIIKGNLPDIWCRDVCPVITSYKRINFRYRPANLKVGDAAYVEDGFDAFLKFHNLTGKNNNLILDGGNYCHNGIDSAVICRRALKDNGMNEKEIILALKSITGSTKIAILPEEEGDTLGHVDGMISWLDSTTMAINRFDEPLFSEVREILHRAFPDVLLVELPYNPTEEYWKGIADATGIYTNILHTKNGLYVSAFDSPLDQRAKDLLDKHCQRPVIQIPMGKVTKMGGSLRCLTWQNRRSGSSPLPL
jgi:agmatine/peptidylarginine deiminase